ncbi:MULTISPECIES: hypothetical protein [unclassified Rhizobium]|uniref:hypothetical protein n=1 Tax=unclassified Rhizobium TaxID=2613769 RepID=UPI0016196F05|nr:MULTISPECIES: hypothetical protein [unclassified Rhizobium]MBB3289545.1 hypothetical protein [Rhizobium sp. BK252]MBB3404487.1 hypothetical protein [Rhizobium sp. BK289]MBB3416873.1 hypothetical protein [Rhizobium sp. BK284]MBB3484750.1 hypothetical protein [Rhizobium sp. BK347]
MVTKNILIVCGQRGTVENIRGGIALPAGQKQEEFSHISTDSARMDQGKAWVHRVSTVTGN